MESDKVNHILMMLSSKIPAGSIPSVRTRLENTDISESEILALQSQMKDPLLSILLSIFIGTLGVDRFYIGDVGLGIGKLLTGGGCGIWWLIDIFLIVDATKQKNLELLSYYLR
ncbi:TM2 domain-containing protein [Prevotella melaninogenica]|jgi:putative TM2 domain family protein|uniref:TM2 domain-containing protein n=1 Tax=Prevotella melaninogenica TaxID=28132 RepID=UPI001CAB6A3A|nr:MULTISPECIES: TM2 domain-containing protein [Prevotella]MBF1617221.1 TM2 domain-containing protein [Prevotella sp.]UEA99023.1 TM2 domain-containing protein [Prevotella melaninogenica]